MTAYARLNAHGSLHLLDGKPVKEVKERVYPHKVPDDVILAMRTMHEIDRKPHTHVMAAFPDYSKHYVRDILNYTLRANLRLK